MGENEPSEQVLVERSGRYELVDARNLLTPESVEIDSKGNEQTAENEGTDKLSEDLSLTPSKEQVSNEETAAGANEENVARAMSPPVSRPASGHSLKSSSQPLLHSKHYKQFERTAPKRQPKRPMSALPASGCDTKNAHELDQEAIQRQEMADAAFEHWKRQKDKELSKKRREQKKKDEESNEQKGCNSDSFNVWLQNKTRQRAEQREVEKLRAQIITSELLSVDYSESELAYERWLKKKNQSKRVESRDMIRKRQEDKEEMKTVLHNIKTRWKIDYNKSNYLHPNTIRGWDDSTIYSNGPPLFPW